MTSNTQLRDAAGEADQTIEDPQGPGKRYSRLFGALFLAGFLVYGIGFGLVSSVTTAPDFMSTLAANSTILVIGAFLMLLNTVVDIGKGVLFFPIAERRGKRTGARLPRGDHRPGRPPGPRRPVPAHARPAEPVRRRRHRRLGALGSDRS